MRSPLEKLEASFKDLFEGKSTVQDWIKDRPDALRVLLIAIDNYLQARSDEDDTISGQFVFYLSEEDYQVIAMDPTVEPAISKMVVYLGTEYGIVFPHSPRIKFIERKSLLPLQIEIKSIGADEPSDHTGSITAPKSTPDCSESGSGMQASLVLSDETTFVLSGPVTNLGRKSNNHIIFDDMRVSRNHAQIRQVNDKYILFDTGSSGGTFVNGARINQYNLKPGDVISLAGVKLIFSLEECPADQSEHEITSKLGSTKKVK
jgi:hypothetical protein